jgi:hypothetical protein
MSVHCCSAGVSPVKELFSVAVALAGLAGFALALGLVEQVVLFYCIATSAAVLFFFYFAGVSPVEELFSVAVALAGLAEFAKPSTYAADTSLCTVAMQESVPLRSCSVLPWRWLDLLGSHWR